MKTRPLWGVAALVILAACAKEPPPVAAGLEVEFLLPDASSLEDWSLAEGPTSYEPDTLWEYLNGGAPRYQVYGFEQMVHSRYQFGGDSLSSINLDVYNMGTELGAFGIYRDVRPSDATARTWGAEGYRSGTVTAAWTGAVFVHASADDERHELIETMETLVSRVCDAVDGGIVLPTIIDPLPAQGLMPYSERYVASDLLGHAALGAGVVATYEIDGHRGELFFSQLENESVALRALESYRREKERWTEIETMPDVPVGFRFWDPGSGSGSVLQVGRFVVGVQGDLSLEAQDDLLEQLIGRLGI